MASIGKTLPRVAKGLLYADGFYQEGDFVEIVMTRCFNSLEIYKKMF